MGVKTARSKARLEASFNRPRGRPRKFDAPSRAVTLTLPETVLRSLSAVHHDISRAIVELAQRRSLIEAQPAAALAMFGPRAVISVRPTRELERRAGVQLVPLGNGRALIAFKEPRTVAELELTLQDALHDGDLASEDRHVFEGVRDILSDARRSTSVTMQRRHIIVIEPSAAPRRPPPAKRSRTASRRN